MRVVGIELIRVDVPLRKPIRHASFERSSSPNLIVSATLSDGTVGYGEGVPRPYVTGETVESAAGALARFDVGRHFGTIQDFEDGCERIGSIEIREGCADPRGMAGNSARCALELALLDALCRSCGRSASAAIPVLASCMSIRLASLRAKPGWVRYSGAITADSGRKEVISAWKMRLNNFQQVKVKVGVAGQDDASRLASIRSILGRRDIRLDANEAWHASEVVERMAPLRAAGPSAIEQPVPHGEVDALAELRPRIGVPVILDESLCGFPDGMHAVSRGLADIFNVRLSKCGGIVPSLRLMALAERAGLGVQLGCHPGETGILTAAGRHLASRIDGLRYVEGSYDRHILAENVTVEDHTFGYGGWARPIGGVGLGVAIDRDALARMTTGREAIRYD